MRVAIDQFETIAIVRHRAMPRSYWAQETGKQTAFQVSLEHNKIFLVKCKKKKRPKNQPTNNKRKERTKKEKAIKGKHGKIWEEKVTYMKSAPRKVDNYMGPSKANSSSSKAGEKKVNTSIRWWVDGRTLYSCVAVYLIFDRFDETHIN